MNAELRSLVEARLGVEVRSAEQIDQGWDSLVFEVNAEWIVRVPRRAEVRTWLRKEAALLPLLAPELRVPVPDVAVVEDSPETFFAAHRKLDGKPLGSALRWGNEASLAAQTGEFLATLHDFPAVKAGLPQITKGEWLDEQAAFAGRCDAVLRLLDAAERRRARAMFDSHLSLPPFELALLHADLGPEHILCRSDVVTGVIDWSDARIGDPALDFGWLLHGPGAPFVSALLDAYVTSGGRLDPTLRERALYFHRVGPWHEVLYGLEQDRPELVASGLAGVRARLP